MTKPQKNIIKLFTFILCVSQTIQAQQLPQYSDYMINYVALNPAAAGTPGCLMAKLGYRSQWVGIQGAPQTAFFTVHSDIKRRKGSWKTDKQGWGLKIENDATGYRGPISKLSIQGAYAYHKTVGRQTYLSGGIYAGIMQYDYRFEDIKLPETSILDDPLTAGGSRRALLYPDINLGLMLYNENGYIGYSLKNLIRNRLRKVYGGEAQGRLVHHHYLTMGHRFGKEDAVFSYIPSINIKYASHIMPSFDATFMVNYNNIIDFGLQYRFIDGLNTIVNLKLNNFTIGYAYDYNLSPIKYGSGNSHELIFGYRYCVNEPDDKLKKEHCPAYR